MVTSQVLYSAQKAYDSFIKELTGDGGANANQPDSKGRLPLLEAVRTKELRYVDALIQSSAHARSKDPATGASPLHFAFQQNMVEVRGSTYVGLSR